MITLVAKTDEIALKAFARTMSWAFPAVFMLILPWIFDHGIPYWPLGVTVLMLVLHLVYPKGIYYPYRVWMAIAGVLGWINTRIVLGFAFYCLILPIGLIMRSVGKLQYKSKRHIGQNDSFWIKRDTTPDKDGLENPF